MNPNRTNMIAVAIAPFLGHFMIQDDVKAVGFGLLWLVCVGVVAYLYDKDDVTN